jgi:cytochrome c5
MLRIFYSLLIFTVAAGCYYDSEEYLFPEVNNQCDTTSVTYSGSIQPILEQYCYQCHNNASSNNIKLENYSDVVVRANNGSLYGSIAHESGYSAMPPSGGKLDDCTLAKVRIWINAGSPND